MVSLVLRLLLAALLLASAATLAQQHPQRLILKDGTFQKITQYEVKGDRVRYYSAERFMWEELPYRLVDWPATEQYERDRKEGKFKAEAQAIAEESDAERRAEEALSPVVAPGLRLPLSGGVFLLDTYQGQQQLVQLEQNGGELNPERGKNILRAALNPFSGVQQSIVLNGTRAAVQAHLVKPVFYVNLEGGDAPATATLETPPNPAGENESFNPPERTRYRILRAKPRKTTRHLGNLKISLTGKMSQKQNFVAVNVLPMEGGWAKVTPQEPIEPGEYALVEMLGEKEINLYVWDFGVDPAAPVNATAWKPAITAPEKESKPAELQKRKE
ncbi:MAG: hypothetical protein ACRD2Q_05340 [Terriglobales bacterium]